MKKACSFSHVGRW